MPANITNKIYQPWASNASVTYVQIPLIPSQITVTPGVPSFDDGFVPINFIDPRKGGKAIKGEYLNGLLQMLTNYASEMTKGQYPGWDATIGATGYGLGAFLSKADGSGYWSNQVAGNTSNPDTGGAGWITVGSTSNASDLTTGTLPVARLPQFTGGDVVSAAAGTADLTLADVNANSGSAGSASQSLTIQTDAKGRILSVTVNSIALQVSQVSGAESTANKGVAGGYAALSSNGTVPLSQLPAAVGGAWNFQGLWDASTNTPALTSGTGTNGDAYRVSVAGTTALDGTSDWQVGDWVVFAGVQGSGGAWDKLNGANGEVTSVAGKTGAVTLDATDIAGLAPSATTDTTNASNITKGTLPAAQLPQFTGGDVTTANGGSTALTLATVATPGSFGAANSSLSITLDAKGRVTSVTVNAIELAASAITSGTFPLSLLPTQTGTGDIVLSDSPALTGTTTAVNADFSGNVSVAGTLSATGQVDLAAPITGALSIQQIAAPAAPALITLTGTASNLTFQYAFSAVDAAGKETQVGPSLSFVTGPSTGLSSTNYLSITAPALPVGAVALNLYRLPVVSGTSQIYPGGLIASNVAAGAISQDTGQTAVAFLNTTTAPQKNYTGGLATSQESSCMKVNFNDPSTFRFWEDFTCVAEATTIYDAGKVGNNLTAENTWHGLAIAYSTGIWLAYDPKDGIHNGCVLIGNSEASAAHGCAYYLGGATNGVSVLNPANTAFDVIVGFQLQTTAGAGLYIGFVPPGTEGTVPTAATNPFVGLRFDTSLNDTQFQAVSQSGTAGLITPIIAGDSAWHRFRVRSTGNGTVYMSIDDGVEIAVNTDIPSQLLDFVIISMNNEASLSQTALDYVGIQIFNLKR